MENAHISSSVPITIQPQASETDFKSTKLVSRLGWISFILGSCAFLIHYISLDHLDNFSPINAGIISGFFLMIAGLASVIAGYQEASYRHYMHAQIWSLIANIILAPGLMAVAITALIIDGQDLHPICQPTRTASRVMLFENRLEVYPSYVPCMEVTNLYNLTQILNMIELIIGFICFFIHMILLWNQRKIIRRMNINANDMHKKIMTYTQPSMIDMSQRTFYEDLPPRYEDLPPTQASI